VAYGYAGVESVMIMHEGEGVLIEGEGDIFTHIRGNAGVLGNMRRITTVRTYENLTKPLTLSLTSQILTCVGQWWRLWPDRLLQSARRGTDSNYG